MNYTSAEAAKLLRKLNEERNNLLNIETQSSSFCASLGEDIEAIRPTYDYKEVQCQLDLIEKQIIAVKHAINQFNLTHMVPGFDLTIDQMLVYIPQLTQKKSKLADMRNRLPMQRISVATRNSSLVEYNYANYDIQAVNEDYLHVSDLLSKAQTALDVLNNTETMEIDL